MDEVKEKYIQPRYNDSSKFLPCPLIKWTHIELGAANYAENPDGDSTHEAKNGCSKSQYSLLFSTIDRLIQKKGKSGIFYVNDLQEEDVNYTIKQLEQYIRQQYLTHDIEVKPLTGDFFKIDLPKVDSMHLKNPEYWFFTNLDIKENSNRLSLFADCTREGLTLVTYYKRPFLHRLENLGVGYKIRNPNYSPYIHADGTIISSCGNTIEFIIKSMKSLKGEGIIGYTSRYSFRPQIINRASDVFGFNAENAKNILNKGEKYRDPYFVPPEEPETLLKI